MVLKVKNGIELAEGWVVKNGMELA